MGCWPRASALKPGGGLESWLALRRGLLHLLTKEVKETLDRGCRGVRCHEALLGQVTGWGVVAPAGLRGTKMVRASTVLGEWAGPVSLGSEPAFTGKQWRLGGTPGFEGTMHSRL